MKLEFNTANRSFLALLLAGFLALQVIGLGAIVLVALAVHQVATGGSLSALFDAHDVRPGLAFLSVVGTGSLLGSRSLRRQVLATRELRRKLRQRRVPTPPEVVLAAARTRLTRRVEAVDFAEPFSLTYGLFWPRVVVSTGLLESVSAQELEAVLEHERYHVRNLDPLKVVLARSLSQALFYFPVLRGLRQRYVAGRELAADRYALEAAGRPALAGALYKAVKGPEWSELKVAAAIGGPELLDIRIAQLETGQEPPVRGAGKLAATVTVLSAAGLVWTFAAALGDLQGPIGKVVRWVLPMGLRGYGGLLHLGWGLVRWAFWGWVAYRVWQHVSGQRRFGCGRAESHSRG